MHLSPARAVIAVGVVCVLLFAAPCRADEPAPPSASASPPECREAFEEADLELRPAPEARLIRARELLRRCASPSCQPWMIAACTRSLTEVERRIPTIVLTAHGAGRPVVEARVREGNTWLVQRLDGRSIEVEPGERELVLVLPSGEELRKRFVVEEGARLQRLDFDVPEATPSSPPPVALQEAMPPRAAPSRAPTWLGTAGLVVAAAGLGGLALGTTFGIVALNERDSANCDARRLCDAAPLERANSASTVSTVGFVVGGALLGLGLAALGISLWAKPPAPAY